MEITQNFFMKYLNGHLTEEEVLKLTKQDLLKLYKMYTKREREVASMSSFEIIRWMMKN